MEGNENNVDSGSGEGQFVGDAGTGAGDWLRRAVAAAADGSGSRSEVQAAARALVSELRNRKAAPEDVLVEIKQFLAQAGLRAGFATTPEESSTPSDSTLYRDVITWSIRYYYDDR